MLDFTKDITPHASMADANWELMLEHAARFDAMDNDNVPEGGMGFDMNHPFWDAKRSEHPCGFAVCIIGWHEAWTAPGFDRGVLDFADDMHIPENTAKEIALPWLHGSPEARKATPQHAARLLRYLVATGEVNWPLAMEAV